MCKIKFIGKSNIDFTNGNIYQLVKIDYDKFGSIEILVSNNDKKIKYIPYIDLGTFNENWEVIND